MRPVLTLVLTLLLGSTLARATDLPVPPGPPTTEVHFLVGTGASVEIAQVLLDHRLRFEAGAHLFIKGSWVDLAVLARVLGSPSNALLLRAGAMAQDFPTGCGSDAATAVDLGLAYRHRWAGRSLILAELGGERVSRNGGVCNDSVFSSTSSGLRAALGGQYSFTPALGLYARVGLRTAKHIPELGFLPEAWLGLAFEI